ncbi:YqeG family HAD IIIA-type phosphatase [Candidatus Acetothermia bacterium]|nr:YqeG family HAD IIIA-type phosphatase [Candidatus Acetothermia bacterium]MBI3660990.1 YqeG family HAD IIIA-type phosphatase [Candidatus Acetothermia bacterium]
MIEKFLPDERQPSIYTIDYEALWQKGLRGLIFDLDNTLGPHNFSVLDESVFTLLEKLKRQNFRMAFISNHNGEGRQWMNEKFDKMSLIFHAKKPLRSGFLRTLQTLQLKPEETVMIGDQLFTDILGAKRYGFYTILVDPVDERTDTWPIRWRRLMERRLLKL